jgi:hypothetical protein
MNPPNYYVQHRVEIAGRWITDFTGESEEEAQGEYLRLVEELGACCEVRLAADE